MAGYSMIIDIEKCTGCFSCFLSCKDEHVGNAHAPVAAPAPEGQRWIDVKEVEYGTGDKVKVDYIPIPCQHCDNPACARGAPEGAVYTRPDGIVIIDPEKAKGAKDIVKNCPYGAVYWNEALELPQKCTMCAHMLDAGEKTTRCAECCPTGALVFGDLNDPGSEISQIAARFGDCLEIYKPQFGAEPQVKYHALPKPFIAGELAFSDNPGEPACGIPVRLTCCPQSSGGEACCKPRETVTDFMGDFEFKRLSSGAVYTLTINAPGYAAVEREVRVNTSLNLGTIVLEKE